MIARFPATVLWIFFLMTPFLFAGEIKPGKVPSGEGTVESTPGGMDASIQNAQQEVQDPFAKRYASPGVKGKPQEKDKAAPPVVDVALQGVGLGEKTSYAIIGDSVYYEGEEKNGVKLLEVRRGEVDISANGEKRVLSLFPEEELKRAKERQKKKSEQRVFTNDASKTDGPESFPKRGQGLS
jgi:hypothetical protein